MTGRSQGSRVIDFAKLLAFGAAAAIGAFLLDGLQELLPDIFPSRDQGFYLIAVSGLWVGFVGCGVATGITVAQAWYAKRLGIDFALFVAMLSGFIVGMVAGAFGQVIFNSGTQTPVLRTVAWGLTGALLGFALSFQVPNLGKLRGSVAGLIGGAVGCVLFLLLDDTDLPQALARMFGVAMLGGCIGAMISIGEGLFRTAWLELQYATGDVRQLTLGSIPVTIGSDKKRSMVIVPGLAPLAYRFRILNGRVVCEDVAARKMDPAVAGETLRLGSVRVTVCGKLAAPAPRPRSAVRTPGPIKTKQTAKSPSRIPLRRPPRH